MARRVSPGEAHEMMQNDGWSYLDVRSEGEFEQGHPQGAVNVPLMHRGDMGMTPNDQFLSVVEANYPKDAKLVVGCQAGNRSARAAQMLEGAGYTQIVDQRAGWGGSPSEPGWQGAGLPVESGSPEGRSYQSLVSKS